MLVIGALGAASHQLIDIAVRRSLGRFRIRLVDQILSLPKVVHDGSERMRLHTLVVTDIETVQRSLNSLATQILPNGLLAVVLITVLAVQSPAMVLGLMASLIASHLVTNHLWQNLLAAQRRFRSTLTEFGSEFATTLRTLEVTWYQQGSVLELERHRSIIKRLTRTGEEVGWRTVAIQAGHQLVIMGLLGGLCVVATWSFHKATLSPGTFVANFLILFFVVRSIRPNHLGLPDLIQAYEAWISLLAFEHENQPQPYGGHQTIPFSGRIKVSELAFCYSTSERATPLLKRISFQLRPGTITVLTGRNGSGKSTLLRLLLGLHRPDMGSIYADGIPYEELDLSHLRSQIGVVPQDSQFRIGTVWRNLTLYRPDASVDEVTSVLRLAMADSVVADLPSGLQTEVGDHGVLLSGGQRQRLALARALIGRPSLLILDEPTNHIDEEGVSQLLANLRRIEPCPAILIVSHLPALLDHADQVLHLNRGEISPRKTEDDLALADGFPIHAMSD
jgi:ABC-type bacteriocin/lantibiotic exporter with double-glycine peptidase domain